VRFYARIITYRDYLTNNFSIVSKIFSNYISILSSLLGILTYVS